MQEVITVEQEDVENEPQEPTQPPVLKWGFLRALLLPIKLVLGVVLGLVFACLVGLGYFIVGWYRVIMLIRWIIVSDNHKVKAWWDAIKGIDKKLFKNG